MLSKRCWIILMRSFLRKNIFIQITRLAQILHLCMLSTINVVYSGVFLDINYLVFLSFGLILSISSHQLKFLLMKVQLSIQYHQNWQFWIHPSKKRIQTQKTHLLAPSQTLIKLKFISFYTHQVFARIIHTTYCNQSFASRRCDQS